MENTNEQKNQQEIMFKASMFEQQIQNINGQLQAIEDGIIEMNSLNLGLDELKDGKGKEILSPLGRGIFAKAKLDSEKLIVDVGGKNFVNKTIPETKKIIGEQVKKLEKMKDELQNKAEEMNKEFMSMVEDFQKLQSN